MHGLEYQSKRCGTCGVEQPRSAFYKRTASNDGLQARCITCLKRYLLEWRYQLTIKQYEEMLAAQGNVCASCGTDEPRGKGGLFEVDHDHSCCPTYPTCGQCTRALLCHRCNSIDGLAA